MDLVGASLDRKGVRGQRTRTEKTDTMARKYNVYFWRWDQNDPTAKHLVDQGQFNEIDSRDIWLMFNDIDYIQNLGEGLVYFTVEVADNEGSGAEPVSDPGMESNSTPATSECGS